MSKTDIIRAEAKLLEEKIANLVDEFVTECGDCNVDIDVVTTHIQQVVGEEKYIGAKINITISI